MWYTKTTTILKHAGHAAAYRYLYPGVPDTELGRPWGGALVGSRHGSVLVAGIQISILMN